MEGLTNTSEQIIQDKDVQNLVKLGKKQGSLSYDDIFKQLPRDFDDPDLLDSLFILFYNMNIPVIKEKNEQNQKSSNVTPKHKEVSDSLDLFEQDINDDDQSSETLVENDDVFDDPIKVYLKEIGNVTLLSQEDESKISEDIISGEEMIKAVLYQTKFSLHDFHKQINDIFNKKYDVAQLFESTNLFHLTTQERDHYRKKIIDLNDTISHNIKKLLQIENNKKKYLDNSEQYHQLESEIKDVIQDVFNVIQSLDLNFKLYLKVAISMISQIQKYKEYECSLIHLSKHLSDNNSKKEYQLIKEKMLHMENNFGATQKTIHQWDKQLNEGKSIISKSKEKLVQSNLRLVISIAKKFIKQGIQFFDLVQEGNIGLIKAVERFKYRKGYRFSTYASWWIKQSITKSISDQSRLIRVPLHICDQIKKVMKESKSLSQTLGREPSYEELADKLEWPIDKVKRTYEISIEPLSLESPIGDSESCLLNFIADKEINSTDYNASFYMLKEQLEDILAMLPQREQEILKLRFGLVDGHNYTLKETGNVFNITRERVRQLEARALKRLRDLDRSKQLKDYLIN